MSDLCDRDVYSMQTFKMYSRLKKNMIHLLEVSSISYCSNVN